MNFDSRAREICIFLVGSEGKVAIENRKEKDERIWWENGKESSVSKLNRVNPEWKHSQ